MLLDARHPRKRQPRPESSSSHQQDQISHTEIVHHHFLNRTKIDTAKDGKAISDKYNSLKKEIKKNFFCYYKMIEDTEDTEDTENTEDTEDPSPNAERNSETRDFDAEPEKILTIAKLKVIDAVEQTNKLVQDDPLLLFVVFTYSILLSILAGVAFNLGQTISGAGTVTVVTFGLLVLGMCETLVIQGLSDWKFFKECYEELKRIQGRIDRPPNSPPPASPQPPPDSTASQTTPHNQLSVFASQILSASDQHWINDYTEGELS